MPPPPGKIGLFLIYFYAKNIFPKIVLPLSNIHIGIFKTFFCLSQVLSIEKAAGKLMNDFVFLTLKYLNIGNQMWWYIPVIPWELRQENCEFKASLCYCVCVCARARMCVHVHSYVCVSVATASDPSRTAVTGEPSDRRDSAAGALNSEPSLQSLLPFFF